MGMYSDLAAWWPLLSPPSHYNEEAADLLLDVLSGPDAPPRTLLELGCGGGSIAWHFKRHLQLTLTDVSPQMLEVSRAVNPECEHVLGDMRSLDLGRLFDVVFVHDAITLATDERMLRDTIATATRHCRRRGAVVLVPDHVKETFEPESASGGEDGEDGRGLRYLEWSWDPDPSDSQHVTCYAFMLREADGTVRVEMDRQSHGLFPRASWLAWMKDAGLDPRARMDRWNRDIFIGRRSS